MVAVAVVCLVFLLFVVGKSLSNQVHQISALPPARHSVSV